jgi:uncharacterized protein (TIGR00255 family)
MTGFASLETPIPALGEKLRIEIKSVNHRFLETKLRLPREYQPFEIQVRQALQREFQRGSLDVRIDRTREAATAHADASTQGPAVRLNQEVAFGYFHAARSLQTLLGLSTDPEKIPATEWLRLPGVLETSEDHSPSEELWPALERALRETARQLREMRLREGEALKAILLQALAEMGDRLDTIIARRGQWEATQRTRTLDRLKRIFENYPLMLLGADGPAPAASQVQVLLETRLAQELAFLLDRSDVQEEIDRFRGHLSHFRETLGAGGPVGKKLDFLLQELGREANTLGTKAQDLGISEEVVFLKIKLEQVREQVMNLE